MLELLATVCAALAAWLWTSTPTPSQRLTRLLPKPAPPRPRQGEPPTDEPPPPAWLTADNPPRRPVAGRTLMSAACLGLIVALLVGGIAGILTGCLITPVAAVILHRREPPELQRDRRRIATDLPFAADLMASCLLAGQPVGSATGIAASSIGGPLGERLTWVSVQLRLGADPQPTWAFLARDPSTAQLSRAMSRAAQSGAPVADVLSRLADDARESARATSVAAARSVGVKAVAPLGLCFLPAFVLLGIIPIVAGLATNIVLP